MCPTLKPCTTSTHGAKRRHSDIPGENTYTVTTVFVSKWITVLIIMGALYGNDMSSSRDCWDPPPSPMVSNIHTLRML